MRFDQAWETLDRDGTRGTDENDRPLVTDGRNVGTIKWVGEQRKPWAEGTGNPDGQVLTVKIDMGPRFRPVWESIRIQWRHKIVELCQSARVAAPVVGRDWDPKCLLDRPVIVETAVAVGKNGEYVKVVRYLPQGDLPPKQDADTAAARESKPKAPSQPVADQGGEDDIPF